MSPHSDVDLEDSKPIFLHDTLAHILVQRTSCGQTFIAILNRHCDLDLEAEHSNPLLSQDF